MTSKLAARTLDCSYVPAETDVDAPSLEIRSAPDPGTLDAMLRLYLGVDRLPHHPVDITGADDAEVVLEPEDGLVTVFLKQGFVTHARGARRRGPRARRADRDQAGDAGAGGELPGLIAEGLTARAASSRSAFQRDSAYSSSTSERTVMPPPVPSR